MQMNSKIELKGDRAENTQTEEASKDEAKPVEGPEKAEEKPLEKMTKSELIQKIKELEQDGKKKHDLYLRSQADLENLKKRNQREKEEYLKYANESLIKELLPVIDHLQMALSHSQNENALHALREGVELTLKGLKDTLGKSGLQEVKAVGEAFDPNYHHAVSEQEDAEVDAGKILQELQKGYTLHQRVIRPAMVVVSKGGPGESVDQEEGTERK